MTAQGKRNNQRQHPNLESQKLGIDITSGPHEDVELLDNKKRISAVFFNPTDPILELPVIDRIQNIDQKTSTTIYFNRSSSQHAVTDKPQDQTMTTMKYSEMGNHGI